MNRHTPSSTRPGGAARAALGSVVVLFALIAACNDPNAPDPSPPASDTEFRGDYDGSQTLRFQLESPGGGVSSLQLLASNLTYDPASGELQAQVAIRNMGSADVQGPSRVLVGDFDPPEVQPLNAESLPCPMCPSCPCPWPWFFDHAGTYGDDGLLAAGETSAPVEWILLVPAGESFSFRARLERDVTVPRSGVIAGSVFVDANHNGHRDLGELGLPGAVVSLSHGDVGASTLTDGNGRFEFEVSEEGLYEIAWNPELDCPPSTPLRRQVVIVRRSDGTLSGYNRADFGCGEGMPPDSTGFDVHGIVFEDLNRNGAWEPGEPGLPGVRIDGSMPNCPTFAPIFTHTDARGAYRLRLFVCQPPYVIQREPLPGFVDTTPNPVVFDQLPVPVGPHRDPAMPRYSPVRVDFGVARDGSNEGYSVEGFVYLDANRNGQLDDGEAGIADVGVSAAGTLCMTPVMGFTRTDEMGHYSLYQSDIHCMPPWLVGHEPVGGHCDTSPNPVLVGAFQMPPGNSQIFRVDFGVAPCDSIPPPQPLRIDGFVWRDTDRDGVREPGEVGIGGAQVELVSPCERLWIATTDPSGYYVFDSTGGCPIHAVVVTRPSGMLHTTPNPFPVDPNAVPADGVLHVDFGLAPMRR